MKDNNKDNNIVNFGIVGIGHIAQIGYIPAIKKMKDRASLYALCDIEEPKLYKAQEIHDVPVIYSDFEELLADPNVDAVIISTPNHLHYPMSIAALSFGKHAIIEKPIALKIKDAEDIIERAGRSKKIIFPSLNYFYRPDLRALKRILFEEKSIGEIFYIKLLKQRKTLKIAEPDWMGDRNFAGSIFHSYLLPLIEIFYFITGSFPEKLIGKVFKDEDKNLEKEVSLYFIDNKGICFLFEMLWDPDIVRNRIVLEVYGEKGIAKWLPLRVIQRHYGNIIDITPEIHEEESLYRVSFQLMLEDFVSAILDNKKTFVSLDMAFNILKIADFLQNSI
jgi:predicted dehydrogenase